MTGITLDSNIEWNTKILSAEQGEATKEIAEEFNNFWSSDYALDFDKFYEIYRT